MARPGGTRMSWLKKVLLFRRKPSESDTRLLGEDWVLVADDAVEAMPDRPPPDDARGIGNATPVRAATRTAALAVARAGSPTSRKTRRRDQWVSAKHLHRQRQWSKGTSRRPHNYKNRIYGY